MPEQVVTTHVVGIDIGMESCTMCCLTVDKRQVIKSAPFANTLAGFEWLFERLEGLGVASKQILVGLEATSRYGENLLQALLKRGYQVCLLHPAQMHAFAQQRGLRAKTDQLDAVTIARALLSGEARFGYVPSEQAATYRELMRLQKQLSDDVVRYKNEIHALLVVLFPEFTQVFVDPTRPTALAVLKRYPSAQAIAQTEVEVLGTFLHELAPRRDVRPTAQELVGLAKSSISSGVAVAARSSSLRILCDQLEHTQTNLEQLQREIDQLLDQDPKATGMLGVPEFGPTTVAVLRAELGDLTRFTRIDQVVAYVGLDQKAQTERQMERADQAVQTRQRASAPHPVLSRVAEHSPGSISLWGLLPSPGGSWHEKGHGSRGSDAQNVDSCRPSDPDGGELRSGESGHAGRELAARLAPYLHGAHPQQLRQQSLWTSSRGQGKRCVRERHHRLFTVRVFGTDCSRGGLTNQTGVYSLSAPKFASGVVE